MPKINKLILAVTLLCIFSFVIWSMSKSFDLLHDTKLKKAKFEMVYNYENLQKIKLKCGSFPIKYGPKSDMEVCAQTSDIKPPILMDPWGEPYIYFSNGNYFVLKTIGKHRLYIDESKALLEANQIK